MLAGIFELGMDGRRVPESLYGAVRTWGWLRRQGVAVARCTPPRQRHRGVLRSVFLVTSLLDTEEYLALDLACCYPKRWGCETVIGRHKTDMGEGQPVLRSKDPGGVMQEMWALSAVYQAICGIIGIAVNAAGVPPARISFPHALAAATDTVAAFPLTSRITRSPRSC